MSLLYRTFFEILPSQLLEFSAFVRHLSSLDSAELSVRVCLTFIAELAFPSSHSGSLPVSKGPSALILLGVDEISKSKCEDDLLNLIGGISDAPLLLSNGMRVAVLPVVTSLSQLLLSKQTTISNRPLSLLPMPVFLPDAGSMLLKELQLEPHFYPIINAMCRSLGNHGRLLEILSEDLKKLHPGFLRALLNSNGSSIDQILRSVVGDIRGKAYIKILVENAPAMTIPVCHALLGNQIGRKLELPGCPMTPDELQMNGIFIGDATCEQGVISPIMSPLQVFEWASRIVKDSSCPELHPLARTLKDVLSIELPFSGTEFERFHAGMDVCGCGSGWVGGCVCVCSRVNTF